MGTDLRTLLVDCRIALRSALGHFEQDPLSARLEAAIREVTQASLPPPSANTKTTAQQVALAWQTVTRGLKLSHPELYEQLSEKVMNLLNVKELVEPVTELLQLDEQVKKLEAERTSLQSRLLEQRSRALQAQAQLDELHKALAAAVPRIAAAGDAQETALKRLEALVAERDLPRAEGLPASGGQAAGKSAAPIDGPVPTRAVLEAVANGTREFSKEQREWMIGETLALTGWQYTPVELIEKGDAWMAQLVLDSPNAPA